QEALAAAQNKAITFGHQELDGAHVVIALLEQEDGLIGSLHRKMDVPIEPLIGALTNELQKRPKVSGPGYQPDRILISQTLSQSLVEAEAQAKRMKDEYVSVEHLFLGLLRKAAGPGQPL